MPALRWELCKDCWVIMGIDAPLTGPRLYDEVWHVAIGGSFLYAT